MIFFQRDIESILEDTFLETLTAEDFLKGELFCQKGFWSHTEESVYVYNKQKIESHKMELLSICRGIPKFQQPCNDHAGTISSLDLMPNMEIISSQPPEDMFYQIAISNHFANLLCGAGIASIVPFTVGNNKAFLIVLDKEYRSYFEE